MKKFKRILFPFYKEERHSFLKRRWWFRLITVIYIVALIVTPFIIFSSYGDNSWCYDSLNLYDYGSDSYKQALSDCVKSGKEAILPAIGMGLGVTLVVHYLFQLLLFKLIINYIILGGKKYEEKESEGDKVVKEKNNFKLSIPLAIILGCLILGGAFYMIQASKQKSIEKQQQIELELKKEADKQDNITKRRSECLQIYKTESDKWNNTRSYEYVPEDDICYVSYKAQQGEWKGVICDDIGKDWNYELWGWDSKITRQMFRRSDNCSNGEFEKEF